jgi:CheY-like chemotaxis protein
MGLQFNNNEIGILGNNRFCYLDSGFIFQRFLIVNMPHKRIFGFQPPLMPKFPKLLLCIEDDEDDRISIEEAATETDPKLVFVAKPNGREALTFLNHQKEQHQLPCLILLDINMPVMNGKETLVAIKKDPVLKDIPIIVFTTSSSKLDQLFCEQYGADMVTKPLRQYDLKRVIEQVVLSRCA